MTAIHAYRWPLLFVLYAALVVIAHLVVLPSAAYAANPDIIGTALFFDLTVWPLLGIYWFVARPQRWSVGRLGLIAITLVRLAIGWLPALPVSGWALMWGALDGLVLGLLAFRLRTIIKTYRLLRRTQVADVAWQGALATVLGEQLARLVVAECEIVYYALLSWQKKPVFPTGATPLTTYHESGQTALLWGILGISCIELVVVHLLLLRWLPSVAAWVTLLSVYGCLLLLAVINSIRVRPSYITLDALHLRLDLRWSVTIARRQIAAAVPISTKQQGALNIALLTAPNLLLTFTEPIQLTGLYGIRKTTRQLTLFVDGRDALLKTLTNP
ncbi:hypothetical protein ACAW74_09170 [Fibrella sp. WM1]|uniref:hypothetical protein n=1 Tax=Fibrella musci TaxID=3242485 RepID=UPI00351F8FE3